MAKYGPGSRLLYVDGFDLLASTVFDFVAPTPEAVLEDDSGVNDLWPVWTPTGLRKGEMSQNGLFDDAADAVNAAFSEQQQTARVICVGIEGNTIGKKFTGLAGSFASSYTRAGSRSGIHKANVKYRVSGAIEEGVILQAVATKTADWDTEGADSVDNLASSANGGAAYQQVGALSGFTGFVGKVRHSSDDITYADLATFANVTSSRNGQRVAVAGTVNRHLAYKGDVTGAGSIIAFGGFARG